MGQYRIIIEGTGIHDNSLPMDADSLANDLLAQLIRANHTSVTGQFQLLNGDKSVYQSRSLTPSIQPRKVADILAASKLSIAPLND